MVRGFVVSGRICALTMLASEYPTLPEALHAPITALQGEIFDFLAGVLERGRQQGCFAFPGEAADAASVAVCALMGAQQLGRVRGVEAFDAAMAHLVASLSTGASPPSA